jgi:class 3 adenylate cyclase
MSENGIELHGNHNDDDGVTFTYDDVFQNEDDVNNDDDDHINIKLDSDSYDDYSKSSPQQVRRQSHTSIQSLTTSDTDEIIPWYREYCQIILENVIFVAIIQLCVIWSIFNDDIKVSSFDSRVDERFMILISVIFLFFAVEIALQCIGTIGYFQFPPPYDPEATRYDKFKRVFQYGSFFFWLDIISTLSLLFEMEWVTGGGLNAAFGSGTNIATASKSGAKAGKVIRIVRMIRLVRLVKLFKFIWQYFKLFYETYLATEQERKLLSSTRRIDAELDADEKNKRRKNKLPRSKVGAAMSALINQRVIILILILLVLIPVLTPDEVELSPTYFTQFMYKSSVLIDDYPNDSGFVALRDQVLTETIDMMKSLTSIIPLSVVDSGSILYYDNVHYKYLRDDEISMISIGDSKIHFSTRDINQEDALHGIYIALFIICILIIGTLVLTSDINKFVIVPIEHMVELVYAISLNPLADNYKSYTEEEGFIEGMETTVLLSTISKIGSLLRVVFGEAGADIIANNMGGAKGGAMSLLGNGVKIESIFGFCDVRQFTDTTECLQEEVMLFVNRIAFILHGIVVQCSGAANKNIGDAFLLTWKLNYDYSDEYKTSLADQALLTFCKALIEITKNQDFILNFSAAAIGRLYKRFPNYAVRIGSGLHIGWAIEGAVGTMRKIDATYLSPHVYFTEFLESSTKAYGVPLLISEPFYDLLSLEAKKFVRQVDRIRKSPTEPPMSLYTYDSDVNFDWVALKQKKIRQQQMAALRAQKSVRVKNDTGRKATQRFSIVAQAEPLIDEKDTGLASPDALPDIKILPYDEMIWEDDSDLVQLRHLVNDDMRKKWATGMTAYIGGDWPLAKSIFTETKAMGGGNDGPSKFLLEFINSHNGVAPSDWHGYRDEGDGGH